MNAFNFNDKLGKFPKCKGIYAIKGNYNNFHLVGQTQQSIGIRWSQHRQNKHDNPYLQNSFNKHGENDFSFVLIEECTDPNKMNDKEIFWIKTLESMKNKNGWNLREGGSHGLYSIELRKKVSNGIQNSIQSKVSREARRKTYTLKSPDGRTITFNGLNKFCKDNNLGRGAIWRLINHKMGVTQHKGWKLP
jgi:group I intron endonuclease